MIDALLRRLGLHHCLECGRIGRSWRFYSARRCRECWLAIRRAVLEEGFALVWVGRPDDDVYLEDEQEAQYVH